MDFLTKAIMKIYTKSGDAGQTGLLAGQRVAKDHPRVEAYGTVDELNATLGLARALGLAQDLDAVIERVQNELFHLGSQLAASDPTLLPISLLADLHVTTLEGDIDRFEQRLPPLRAFILPAGAQAAAALHMARTVCRRAERRVVTLAALPGEQVSEIVIRYLNRLGDFLFVAARAANSQNGVSDVVWQLTS
jgi:cob(I)alamin adenosyltransferase